MTIAILGNYLLGKFSAELNKPIRAITPEAKKLDAPSLPRQRPPSWPIFWNTPALCQTA